MAVKLNKTAYEHAVTFVDDGHFVADERDAWSEDQPTADEENEFIEQNGFHEYAKWHLGIDDEESENTKKDINSPMAISSTSIVAG